jgi:predicted transcriptional regulator
MEVTLTPEQETLIAEYSGRTGRSKSDLIAIAIEQYLEREHQLAVLRGQIQVGLDEIDRGEFIEVTPESMRELVDQICREGRDALEQRKRSA